MQLFFFRHVIYCLFISTIIRLISYRRQEIIKQFKEMQVDGVKISCSDAMGPMFASPGPEAGLHLINSWLSHNCPGGIF